MRATKPVYVALALAAWTASLHGISASDRLSLDAAIFPAGAAEAATVLRVPSFGRYSISASGGTGADLVLVDRMAGTIASGTNRIDASLEAGDYRLRIRKRPADAITIASSFYKDSIPAPYPDLSDGTVRTGSLADLQTASFWLRVEADEPHLVLEIAGRNLTGLRLRRDGVWETGIEPTVTVVDAEPGKPLALLEIDAELEPATYLLTCEGGPRREWADGSKSEPFWIRRGARNIGAMGALTTELDGKGMASFLVPRTVRRFELQVRDARGYSISVAEAGGSKIEAYESAEIAPNASSRRAVLNPGPGGGRRWLVLRGPPGAEIDLRWISSMAIDWGQGLAGIDTLPEYGSYLVSALADFSGGESSDLSAAFVKQTAIGSLRRLDLIESQAPELGADAPIRRRINAVDSQSFLMRVLKKGSYTVLEKDKDVTARYSFIPIDADFGTEKARPVVIEAGGAIELLERMYLVELIPVNKGILDFAIALRSESVKVRRSLSTAAPGACESFTWESIEIARQRSQVLIFGSRGGSAIGVETRKLPLDPEESFFLSLEAGKRITVPIECGRDVAIVADVPGLSLYVDGRPAAGERVARGRHTLEISTSIAASFVVEARPLRTTARPVVDPFASYDVFSEGKPLYRDFQREEHAVFLLDVAEPGPYRVETSGRLAMSISIRGTSEPKLFSASMNGSGRNAIVSAYLRPGRYLVDVKTEGKSAGRAGLCLVRPRVLQAGRLAPGGILRATVEAGDLLSASVEIPARKRYEISCLCLGTSPSYRFEDEGGWPVDQPLAAGSFWGELTPGAYRYISYPATTGTRRVLRLGGEAEAIADTTILAIGSRRESVWNETAERSPDLYRIDSPARIQAFLELSEGMEFRLISPDGADIAAGRGGESIALELPKGSNRLELRSMEVDNLREYSVAVSTRDLYEGSRSAIAPGTGLPISIGRSGFVELWSYGDLELEGGIYDESGSLRIASSEPIADDWNFRIVTELDEGRYILRTWPAGERPDSEVVTEGEALVYLTSRDGRKLPARSGDFSENLRLKAEVATLEFTPAVSGTYRLELSSQYPARMTIERIGNRIAAGTSPLLIPLEAKKTYVVKAWLSGESEADAAFSGKRLTEGRMSLVDRNAPAEADLAETCIVLALDHGLSAVIESTRPLLWSPGFEKAFQPLPESPIWSVAGSVRIAAADGSALGALSAKSLTLETGGGLAVELGDMRQSFNVAVPSDTVALLRAAGSTGIFGLCASKAASYIPGRIDWGGFAGKEGDPALGLGPGAYRATLWDADSSLGRPKRRSAASIEFYAILRREKLPSDGNLALTLPPRSAVEIRAGAPGQAIEMAIERGMAAFGADGTGFLDAADHAVTGFIGKEAGAAYVVNAGGAPAFCRARASDPASSARNQPAWGPSGIELIVHASTKLSCDIRTVAGDTVWIYGSADSARMLADDGFAYESSLVETEFGRVLELPAKPGRLEISASIGYLKAWMGDVKDRLTLFARRDPALKGNPLPSGGAALSDASGLWDFRVAEASIVALESDAAGFLVLYDESGACLGATASAEGQTLLRALKPGRYSAFARPFEAQQRSGYLRLSSLKPIAVEGETATVLMAPGERLLFRFEVKAPGLVGIGVAAQSEDLSAALYDGSLSRLGEGAALVRELGAGAYYYVVEAGPSTQRIEARFFGLEGSRAEAPREVVESYREGMEDER